MEFQEYMKQGKEIFTPYTQKELASIPLETLYALDIKQFGITESSVNQKAVEKDSVLQYKVKTSEGTLENPIYNFFRFRIWPRFDCDKADVSKQYYEETYGWNYDNRTLLNKDTAYSFLGIYKTLMLHMDVLDAFTSSQTEDINVKNIFFYEDYAKYEGKYERFGWMMEDHVKEHYKKLNEHPDIQKFALLTHTLGNFVLVPDRIAKMKFAKFKDCWLNALLTIMQDEEYQKPYFEELKERNITSKEDLIKLFHWDIYLDASFFKEEGKLLEELCNMIVLPQSQLINKAKLGYQVIQDDVDNIIQCVRIINQKILETNKRIFAEW